MDLGGESVGEEDGVVNSNSVSDLSPLRGLAIEQLNLEYNNNISDISAVSGMTELIRLRLAGNSLKDISPVAGLTNLRLLTLDNNTISDISQIAGLTNLRWLYLGNNSLSNISALAGLKNLTWLLINDNIVSDISAVEGLAKLERLDFSNNAIWDISAVEGLTKLERLGLSNNSISDIFATAGLTNLELLLLEMNSISDISPVAGLTNLKWLVLNENRVSDISALGGLAILEGLYLGNNSISDISTITDLTRLTSLNLENNSVADISPLVENTGFGYGAAVNLSVNPLSYQSIHMHVPTLQDREVTVRYDNRVPNSIGIVSGNEQRGLPSEKLANPFVVEVRDGSGSPFEGVPVTFTITEGGGTLSVTRVTTNDNGRAESLLTIGPNPGKHTVSVSVEGTEARETFTAEGIRVATKLEIISGNGQTGHPGFALENPFVVEVRDQTDVPLPGVQVTFSVTGGGGALSAIRATTDTDGRAASTLTLGSDPGTNSVEVNIEGSSLTATFNAEASLPPPVPTVLSVVSGDNQNAPTGRTLAKPLVVEVRDQYDDPMEGVTANFAVSAGGGSLSDTSVDTNANGLAQSILTLGQNTGINTVTVSVTGIQDLRTFNAGGIRIPLAFWIITGFDQKGMVGEALAKPFLVEVRDHTGEPLPGVQVTFTVSGGGGTLSVTSETTDADGRVTTVLTLGPDPGTNTVEVAVTGIEENQTVSAIAELPPIPEDVNGDNVVNIFDLVAVASVFGDTGENLPEDINGEGVVNIFDLVLVAGAIGNAAAAPGSDLQALAIFKPAEVREWLAQAGEVNLTDTASRNGVLFLGQLLAALTPKETVLLPNYPNPFNPETWIPYELANDSDVQISIFDISGVLVRQLELGHQRAGYYSDRGRAAYWDGCNSTGEQVASGVYFYTLTADSFRSTRKMLVGK